MLKLYSNSLILQIMVMGFLAVGVILQTGSYALADYDPPGGDPPPGNTSTSGMSLQ